MVRWIALSQKGKRGESLYPGKSNPENSYKIDELVEISDGYLVKGWSAYVFNPPVSDDKAKEIVSTVWNEFLTKCEAQLGSNSNPNFMVGNCMTIADTAIGAYFCKLVIADTHQHRHFFAAEVDKFPMTKNWCMNTLKPAFGEWIKTQKVGASAM